MAKATITITDTKDRTIKVECHFEPTLPAAEERHTLAQQFAARLMGEIVSGEELCLDDYE